MRTSLAIFTFGCTLFGGHAIAQNYREDILAVNKTLLGQKTYSLQLHYEMYLDGNMATPFQQRDVKIIRQNANLYMKQDAEMEVVETQNYQFMIDHDNKLFSAMAKNLDANKKDKRGEAFKLIDIYVDTIVSSFQKIKVVYNDDKTVKYECTLKPNDNATMVWVEIDKKLKFYKSLTTQYKQKTKVRELDNKPHALTLTVRYAGFSKSPAVSPLVFSETNYVVIKDKKLIGPAKRFINYKYSNGTP